MYLVILDNHNVPKNITEIEKFVRIKGAQQQIDDK
jgi:hypothetical protein